jgi:LPXTG-motif cell wall-anchored protein
MKADWTIIVAIFVIVVAVGFFVLKRRRKG